MDQDLYFLCLGLIVGWFDSKVNVAGVIMQQIVSRCGTAIFHCLFIDTRLKDLNPLHLDLM